jgi:hypothetical protein
MSNIGLGLPSYISDQFGNLGLAETLRRTNIQLRGADTKVAFDFYSSIIVALQAINNLSVPSVLSYGQAATTQDYAYALVSLPALVSVGKISDWAYGRASINLAVVGAISDWAIGKAPIPRLAVVAAAT